MVAEHAAARTRRSLAMRSAARRRKIADRWSKRLQKELNSAKNGSAMGVSSSNTQPVATSVSFNGSASARYVDDDTGQVTISTVYVQ